jgi:Fe-S cluster assembly protein SufD
METKTENVLSKQSVLQLSEQHIEPGWLRQKRLAALEQYERANFPTGKEENWLHTNAKIFAQASEISVLPNQPKHIQKEAELPHIVRNNILPDSEKNGVFSLSDKNEYFLSLLPQLQSKGVIVTSIVDGMRNYSDLLESYFMKDSDYQTFAKFELQNAASWNGGIIIYIPANTQVELPIQVIHHVSNPDSGYFPHNLIIVDKGASVKILESYHSQAYQNPFFVNGFTEVYVEDNAQIDYITISNWGEQVIDYHTKKLMLQRDASANWITALLGGSQIMYNLETKLNAPNSNVKMYGFFYGNEEEHFHINTYQNHQTDHATSDLLYKGVLQDKSSSVYRGSIVVAPNAQRTDAYQANRNLLLSDDAHVNSIPMLEIEANDVRCTHGATVGQIDRDQIFYLQSRGLNRSQAEKIIMDGFIDEVVVHIPSDTVQTRIHEEIDRKYYK